jgi:hypothetical protein
VEPCAAAQASDGALLKGADTVTAGSSVDDIKYTAAAQSTGTSYDTILGFDAASDRFSVWTGVNGVNPTVNTGSLSTASCTADLTNAMSGLGANDAVSGLDFRA